MSCALLPEAAGGRARRLCAFMGFDVADGSADSYRRAGRRIPFVRLDAAPGRHPR
ncbi:hypothetical protein [Streptomyces sp. NPDC048142]|uniref:hypothetical protein n=1 Tax=Streptomyces sp. NPDC048142 TaxID=3365501 RepID=UPI00371A3B10